MMAYATIEFGEEENEDGRMQACVHAMCEESGEIVGPIWGHGENSIRRALASLTGMCGCGADYHEKRED